MRLSLLRRGLYSFDLRDTVLDLTGVLPPDPEELGAQALERIVAGLDAAGEDAVRELAGAISDALGPTEPHWWAAFSFEVDAYLRDEGSPEGTACSNMH